MNKIYDAHIHFIPEEIGKQTAFYKGIWSDKEKLYAFLQTNDVEKALLVYPATDARFSLGSLQQECTMYNSIIARMLKENQRLLGAGLIDVFSPQTLADQAKQLHDQGFVAVNLASSYDGTFLVKELIPLFKAAEQLQMPLFVHPQTINPIGFDRVKDPLLMPVLEYSFDSAMYAGLLMMDEVLQTYNITFIFSSLAGVLPFLQDRFDRVYAMLRTRNIVKNLGQMPTQILRKIYVDIAGASIHNIESAVELFGADHLLWGSDYPVAAKVPEQIQQLDKFGKQIKEQILETNFKQLFSPQF